MNNPHPNATAGVGSTGVGALVVWLLNRYAGAGLNAEEAVGVATIFTGLGLLIGRRGLVGLWEAVRYGSQGKPAKG